jgi:hypothetical protein
MKLAAATCLLLSIVASAVSAEEPATLAPGLRVRITDASGARLTGRIQSTNDDALNVWSGNRGVVTLRRAEVVRLEVGFGRNYAVHGAVAGGLLGLGAGLAIDNMDSDGCGCRMIAASPFTAMAGTGVGYLIGRFIRPARWSDLPLDRVRISVAPVPGNGGAVRISLAF